MSTGSLTEIHKDLINILRALGASKEKIISVMPLVKNPEIANLVADKILEMQDTGEEITLQKVIKLMATTCKEN